MWEDYYGYPLTRPDSRWRVLRQILLWPNKILRELRGRHPLPWRGEGKVLDVGCGPAGLKTLQDQGWEPHGIEISEIAAAHARELNQGTDPHWHCRVGTVSAGAFDLVLMSHSLNIYPAPLRLCGGFPGFSRRTVYW